MPTKKRRPRHRSTVINTMAAGVVSGAVRALVAWVLSHFC
jgi:hypothetical protein